MVRLMFLLLALASSSGAFAQESLTPDSPRQEAICGFLGDCRYCEADQVRHGLSVDLFVGDVQANQPVNLRFFVNLKPRDVPVEKLQIEHEKFIHVIGVRDDLTEFFHIHPVKGGPGMWTATHNFKQGGNYKIWADVKYQGTSYAVGHPLLKVPGNNGNAGGKHDFRDTVVSAGYRITLRHPEPLVVQSTNRLQFSIRDSAGDEIQTENFLGSLMHLVIIKDDLSVYRHAHPDHPGTIDPKIYFSQIFPTEGVYKLFAQFRPQNTKLPPDDAIMAEFYVKVTPSPSPRTSRP